MEPLQHAMAGEQIHPVHFSDAGIVLKVEETLFRVDQSLLCTFDAFRDMFETAGPHNREKDEGWTDVNPIVIQGVTAFEMESLLHVIEARWFWFTADPELSLEQWKAVLRLADLWENKTLHQRAVQNIEDFQPSSIELFVLGNKCQVEEWLKPALMDMCLRSPPLTSKEIECLGLYFVTKLIQIREGCLFISPAVVNCTECHRPYSGKCGACRRSYDERKSPSFSRQKRKEFASNLVDRLLASDAPPLSNVVRDISSDGRIIGGHHPIYSSGNDITYQVEQTLFRTSETVIRNFPGLHRILASKQHRAFLILKGVTVFEMATTLDVLNYRWFEGEPEVDFHQWKAVLHVATQWYFKELREYAISKIDDLRPPPSPLDFILLARKCDVSAWLITGYTDLCMRPEPITVEEGNLLGMGPFAELVRIRESQKDARCPDCNSWTISITCGACRDSLRLAVVTAVVAFVFTPAPT